MKYYVENCPEIYNQLSSIDTNKIYNCITENSFLCDNNLVLETNYTTI